MRWKDAGEAYSYPKCLLFLSESRSELVLSLTLAIESSSSLRTTTQRYTTMIRRMIRPASTPYKLLFRRHGVPRRTLIAAPTPGSGPLMSRRADRELPPIISSSRRWLRTLPIFLTILVVSSLGIFNYQKASSPIVNATLYALRTSKKAREVLGDEIYFASQMPWIWGEMNQLHGRINISFGVKGTKAKGTMRFKSVRKTRMGYVSIFCDFSGCARGVVVLC